MAAETVPPHFPTKTHNPGKDQRKRELEKIRKEYKLLRRGGTALVYWHILKKSGCNTYELKKREWRDPEKTINLGLGIPSVNTYCKRLGKKQLIHQDSILAREHGKSRTVEVHNYCNLRPILRYFFAKHCTPVELQDWEYKRKYSWFIDYISPHEWGLPSEDYVLDSVFSEIATNQDEPLTPTELKKRQSRPYPFDALEAGEKVLFDFVVELLLIRDFFGAVGPKYKDKASEHWLNFIHSFSDVKRPQDSDETAPEKKHWDAVDKKCDFWEKWYYERDLGFRRSQIEKAFLELKPTPTKKLTKGRLFMISLALSLYDGDFGITLGKDLYDERVNKRSQDLKEDYAPFVNAFTKEYSKKERSNKRLMSLIDKDLRVTHESEAMFKLCVVAYQVRTEFLSKQAKQKGPVRFFNELKSNPERIGAEYAEFIKNSAKLRRLLDALQVPIEISVNKKGLNSERQEADEEYARKVGLLSFLNHALRTGDALEFDHVLQEIPVYITPK